MRQTQEIRRTRHALERQPAAARTVTTGPAGAWYLVPSVSAAGLLAWVPFPPAAGHLDRPGPRGKAKVYGVAAAALLILSGFAPVDAAGNPAGPLGTVLAGLTIIGMLALLVLSIVRSGPPRRELYRPQPREPAPAPAPAREDPALAAVLAARARRARARELLVNDPAAARELGVGRAGRRYDDGGLVDLNSQPAAVIAAACGLDPAAAQRIVAARTGLGGAFGNIEEVLVIADVPLPAWERVRERAVLME